jgi:anti-sigma factor (TIGR02949 family)
VSCEQLERNLDAYVDHEMDLEAAPAIRDHVDGCVSCRRRVAERQALSRLVRSMPYAPAPDRLRARVVARTSRPRSIGTVLTWAAAAALVLTVGGAGLLVMRSTSARDSALVDEVVNGHVRSLMANHLFDVQSTDQHTVKPWFLGKLDFAPPVVDLASIGYPLVGGRLDYLGGRPVAALVYQRRQHTINVFVSPMAPMAPDRTTGVTMLEIMSVRGFHVRHWSRDGMSFWAVSDLSDAELTEFVRTLQGG